MVPLLGLALEQNESWPWWWWWKGVFHLAVPPSFPSASWLLKFHVLRGPLLVATLFILSWSPPECVPKILFQITGI